MSASPRKRTNRRSCRMSALCQKQTSPPLLLVLTEKESHGRGRGWESRSSRRLHCSLRHAFQPTQDSVAVTLIGHKTLVSKRTLNASVRPIEPAKVLARTDRQSTGSRGLPSHL